MSTQDKLALPMMRDLPRGQLPTDQPLVLASGSPRRSQLLTAAGYSFSVRVPGEEAECGICSRETAPEMVARYALRKAADVAGKLEAGLVVAADTVATCVGMILGKPRDRQHADQMLQTLSGRRHDVYTGICVWSVRDSRCVVDAVRTQLQMRKLTTQTRENYLDTLLWEGKAGAFGYQDGNDWVEIIDGGSESNVVGLPMERFAELLENFDSLAETINIDTIQR